MPSEVFIDELACAEFIRSPDGPVARRLMVIGEAVKVETVRSLKPGFPQDFLGPTILKRMTESGGELAVRVGTDKVHTRPHVINGNPTLVFHWPKAGKMMFLRHVNHPGSDFTAYVAKKLQAALAVAMLGEHG